MTKGLVSTEKEKTSGILGSRKVDLILSESYLYLTNLLTYLFTHFRFTYLLTSVSLTYLLTSGSDLRPRWLWTKLEEGNLVRRPLLHEWGCYGKRPFLSTFFRIGFYSPGSKGTPVRIVFHTVDVCVTGSRSGAVRWCHRHKRVSRVKDQPLVPLFRDLSRPTRRSSTSGPLVGLPTLVTVRRRLGVHHSDGKKESKIPIENRSK